MAKVCSKCGQRYPDRFSSCTCRICGGTIELWRKALDGLKSKDYAIEAQWQEWKKKYDAAPPRPMNEDAWLDACSFFNHCSLCGAPDIDEELLVVPPFLGGKRYTYNVVPACSTCAKRIRRSQTINPLRSFYTVEGVDKALVGILFKYLDAKMLDSILEVFNYDEDSLEIIVTCPETTSVTSFNGIYAKRIFEEPHLEVLYTEDKYQIDKREETYGVTWRLLDE